MNKQKKTTAIAVVTLQLTKLTDLSSHLTAGASADGPYWIAWIGNAPNRRFIGRSKPLACGQTEYDFGEEPERWVFKTRLVADTSGFGGVPISLWLHSDHDIDPPEGELVIDSILPIPSRSESSTNVLKARSGSAALEVQLTTKVAGLACGPLAPRDSAPSRVCLDVPKNRAVARVDIEEILGVHEPAKASSPELWSYSRPRLSGYGRDELGRVYLNRKESGEWRPREQAIQLTAKVALLEGAQSALEGATIEWTVRVPDDRVTENASVRVEALKAFRNPRSDAPPKHPPKGKPWPGNHGATVPALPWENVEGFAMSDVTDMSAKTALVGDLSRVRLHCPNHAGDRLIVQATVRSASGELISIEDVTGTLTMWQRLDVQYRPLERPTPEDPEDERPLQAYSLVSTFDVVNEGLAPACVQFDFHLEASRPIPPRAYAEGSATNPPKGWDRDTELAYGIEAYERPFDGLVSDGEMFDRKNEPGWFLLAAAFAPWPYKARKPLLPGVMEWTGTARVVMAAGEGAIILPDELLALEKEKSQKLNVGLVEVVFGEPQNEKLRFVVDARHRDALILGRHELVEDFDVGDGDIARITRKNEKTYKLYDYFALAERVQVTLRALRGHETIGASPLRNGRFAGQLIIFTWYVNPPENDPALFARIMIHELSHALGVPHLCGHWAYRHGDGSCQMNYWTHAVRRNGAFIKGSVKRNIGQLCGLHISQLRRASLPDNPNFSGDKQWRK
ncbi:MAG: hypothetical protein U0271_20230 [Polyangiaceae bacterium]